MPSAVPISFLASHVYTPRSSGCNDMNLSLQMSVVSDITSVATVFIIIIIIIITGAAEPRGPGGQLTPPLFQVRGPHMDVEPHFL